MTRSRRSKSCGLRTCSSAKSDRPTIPRLPRLRLRRPLLPSKTGHAEKGLGEAGAEARVTSDEHVLQHGHPTEQLGVLKAAGHAEAGEGVRRAPAQLLSE